MTALRWSLGCIAVLFGVGFVVLALLGSAFRRSFGASGHGPWFILLPALAMMLIFASVLFPLNRPLLHVAAVVALGMLGFCVQQILGEGEAPVWFAVLYLVIWFVYYWLAAWRPVAEA